MPFTCDDRVGLTEETHIRLNLQDKDTFRQKAGDYFRKRLQNDGECECVVVGRGLGECKLFFF